MRGILPFALVAALLFGAPLGAAGAFPEDCTPTSAPAMRTLDAGPAGFYYVREYSMAGNLWAQVWQETNGVPGLQPDPTWNCGHPGDLLLAQRCVGKDCPATVV